LVITDAQIEFDNVTFLYGGKTGGLNGLNLTIKAGEKIGIVGASGAGKTTLVNLLLRLYDLESGEIRVSGHNVAGLTQASLRHAIGMVSQDTAMFNRSAFDNIHYGNPDTPADAVYAAAEKAQAASFIKDLRDFKGRVGYDAHLGERGVKLSGGQRQRIAIARTILKDAPILILDEATSALDSEVEAAIQSSLDTVMQGKTVLAIAHRLSTISRMDRIVVLDQGRVVEDGTHSELLARDGLYARYWNRQSGGFIGVDAQAAE
jgi:ATP-binding cassette subfamily B protein